MHALFDFTLNRFPPSKISNQSYVFDPFPDDCRKLVLFFLRFLLIHLDKSGSYHSHRNEENDDEKRQETDRSRHEIEGRH